MYSIEVKDMDLGQIAESGQCFRMNYIGQGAYSIVAFGRYVEVSQHLNTVIFSCDKEEYEEIWKEYFDIDTDYSKIKEDAKSDEFLSAAIQYGSGIRILKQDLWEMLITFIISQRKSIPNIKKCVETLCYRYGNPISGESFTDKPINEYAFPTAERLSTVSIEELRDCGLGYRDVYVSEAAKWFVKNMSLTNDKKYAYKNDITYLSVYPYAKTIFTQITGVGNKIVNCVCLFALHQLEACPIDTHMQQIIDNVYKGIMPEWMISDKAGILQQYAFYYKKNNFIKKARYV